MKAKLGTRLGGKLKVIRRTHGWRRSEVDQHMEWPPGTLRQLERGKLWLTLAHAHEICSLYEYDMADLAEHVRSSAGG